MSMTIADYRKSLGLSQSAFATALGLRSKGHVSDIERDGRCSPEIALAIETHSRRLVDAGTLNETIAAARRPVEPEAGIETSPVVPHERTVGTGAPIVACDRGAEMQRAGRA